VHEKKAIGADGKDDRMTTPGRRRQPASGQRRGGSASRQAPSQAGRPSGTGGGAPRRGKARDGRPLPAGDSLYTPDARGTRSSVERSSAKPLVLLHQLPAWLLPLVMLALLVAGLALPGWTGATALVLVAVLLGWLGYMSWPALATRGRLLRVAAVACVLAVAVIQAVR
jgi:hypothetical protein